MVIVSLRSGCERATGDWGFWGMGDVMLRQTSLRLACALATALFVYPSIGTTPAAARGELVAAGGNYSAGTIVVHTEARALYLYLGNGRALRYPVGVGRLGKQWSGTSYIDGKYVNPAWSPPDDIRHDKPNLPAVIPGGSPKNPMGVAAMTLHGGQYAIHGTNQPGSIGGFVSYGCIRMYNADVSDLFGRVGYGTQVVVTR